MKKHREILAGLWLDQQEAIIVRLDKQEPLLKRIESNIEHFHPTGGSRSQSPWGPQDVMRESTYLNRKKQQLKDYFSAIMVEIKEVSKLLIIGPGEVKNDLQKHIRQFKSPSLTHIKTQPSDKITNNQLVALVIGHFDKLKT